MRKPISIDQEPNGPEFDTLLLTVNKKQFLQRTVTIDREIRLQSVLKPTQTTPLNNILTTK